MQFKSIFALLSLCIVGAAYQTQVAEAASPFAWLGLGKTRSPDANLSEVSQVSHTPTAMARMSNGTKRLVSNTKKMFVAEKPPAKRRGVTATHRVQKPEPPKQNFIKRLFNPEPTPPPKTVNEWMRLKQVHP